MNFSFQSYPISHMSPDFIISTIPRDKLSGHIFNITWELILKDTSLKINPPSAFQSLWNCIISGVSFTYSLHVSKITVQMQLTLTGILDNSITVNIPL